MKFIVEMNDNDFEQFKEFLKDEDDAAEKYSFLRNIKEMFMWESNHSGLCLNLRNKVKITLIED